MVPGGRSSRDSLDILIVRAHTPTHLLTKTLCVLPRVKKYVIPGRWKCAFSNVLSNLIQIIVVVTPNDLENYSVTLILHVYAQSSIILFSGTVNF